MIKLIKEQDGQWMIWNKSTNDIATIVKITEQGMLASKTAKYRVDYDGQTVDTMIQGFQRARSIATRLVK